jgi:hypothetical protein
MIKPLLALNHFGQEFYQTNAYLYGLYTYRTTGKINVVYIPILMTFFLELGTDANKYFHY